MTLAADPRDFQPLADDVVAALPPGAPRFSSATTVPGVLLVDCGHKHFGDERRGWFREHWREEWNGPLRIPGRFGRFVQSNLSHSVRDVVRGLHLQLAPRAQGKLISVLAGTIWDVAVDVRPDSPTFRRWVGVRLDAATNHHLWVPPGFAHGFCCLSDEATVLYRCSEYYSHEHEAAIHWADPDLAVRWPVDGDAAVLSPRDAASPTLAERESAGTLPRLTD